jgi:hypothetical protein
MTKIKGKGKLYSEQDDMIAEALYDLDSARRRISQKVWGPPYQANSELRASISGTMILSSPTSLEINDVLKLQLESEKYLLVVITEKLSLVKYRIAETAG